MRFVGTVLLFGGYCLVYAAVAKGGVFATDPWNGVFADAYTDFVGGGSGSAVASSVTGTGAVVGSAVANIPVTGARLQGTGRPRQAAARVRLPQVTPAPLTGSLHGGLN